MTPGEIIPATVIDIKNDFVITNAGLKSEGIIPKNQFMNSNGELEVSIGDVVDVTLDLVEDGYGETRISREKARKIGTWKKLEEALETGEFVEGMSAAGKFVKNQLIGIKIKKLFDVNILKKLPIYENKGTLSAFEMALIDLMLKEEKTSFQKFFELKESCLLYTSPSPRDRQKSRMPSSA